MSNLTKQIASFAVIALLGMSACLTSANRSPLNNEAFQEGVKYGKAHIQECGDSQFTYYYGIMAGRIDPAHVTVLIQFTGRPANFGCTQDDRELSKADKLNGLEWKGTCTFVFDSYRVIPRKFIYEAGKGTYQIAPGATWGEWKDRLSFLSDVPGITDMPLQKRNGKWEFDQTQDPLRARLEPAPCDQIPK